MGSFAQNNAFMYSINTSGKDLSGNDGIFNYSIGQVFYSQIDDATHIVTEGIQQSLIEERPNNEDIDVPEDPMAPNANILVYPNPTNNHVTLVSNGFNFNNDLNSYQLYDYQGKLLKQQVITQTNTSIDLSPLSASIYLLQVYSQEKLFKTIKIVKK
ncbi:hypothetical protein GCM10023330_27150 [Litoribaculum gwangyangense]|uniref:Secretion system C-terminal sorting domain-containing protein n=2 Tax=Litoribaculum gwangyangense TaxID=1130722 RepID=A0ABP9CSD8_9FLAO